MKVKIAILKITKVINVILRLIIKKMYIKKKDEASNKIPFFLIMRDFKVEDLSANGSTSYEY